ncbi:uncharacterized protein EDB93DRAFT_1245956 [Suillus bovinus]|uniref:uncharacterized protein n=1 Tax=Suillus bovinus TaxID=48563 RepID=UPI001B883AD8|nr:uncharacterized protein EDB93DRAFT_1245956 [Suillus bovinus]KAG2158724.1 hypothetical protein EDB93DRAFT_1245956 [Suillus bovinus]
MASMFPLALIERFVVLKSVDCTDLSASDRFFYAIIQNAFVPLSRNAHVWRPCVVPVPDKSNRVPVQSLNYDIFYGSSHPYSPPLSDVDEDEMEHIIIKTAYNLLASENKSFKTPRNKADNDTWSANERLQAERGERVRSIDSLWAKGNEAPKEVQPWLLEKEGMRTNYQQVIPYISKDLRKHQHIYSTISHVYAELFEWMETFLQEEFEMLMEVVSMLPGNHSPPFAPFISLVTNINVRTKAHRDGQDRHLCLVIPIGHFQGGALCLLENGLVLELRSGDVVLFRSSEVTHFNLDYNGARVSPVFQTDREFSAWLKNQNGWICLLPPNYKVLDYVQILLPYKMTHKATKPQAKGKVTRALTPAPPIAKIRAQRKPTGSKVQVSDDQYEEFLKFQAQKKKKAAEVNHKENVQKKVDAMLDEETQKRQVFASTYLTQLTVAIVSHSHPVVPDDSDMDHIDDADPADILPSVVPPKEEESMPSPDGANEHSGDEGANDGDEDVSVKSTGTRRRTNGLIKVKDEPQEDNGERIHRKRVHKGDTKLPTTLASLKKDGCGSLVDLAHQLLHIKIALVNAFPGPSVDVQDSFAWDCIKEAVKNPGSPLKPMFDAISQDPILKNRALTYVWSGASQLRGELVRKARENVIFLLQQMKPRDIGEVASWLVSAKKDPFLCGELDLKSKTFNKNLPFRAALLRQLLISQFLQSAVSEGLLYKDEFEKLPDNLLALIATVAECTFNGMLTGSPVVIEFKEPVFQPREACRFVVREDKDFGSELDFDAMEASARVQTNAPSTTSDVAIA